MAQSAAAASGPDSSSVAVQLLVRNIDSRTTVMRAQRGDTLESVLDRLGEGVARSGELRVVHAGRELPHGATIGELGLPWDATLHVSARLLSTRHVDAWDLACKIAGAARLAAAGQKVFVASLEMLVRRFLDFDRAAKVYRGSSGSSWDVDDHLDVFLRSGAPVSLVQLYLSEQEEACRGEAARAIRCFQSAVETWTEPVLLEFCWSFAAGARLSDPLYTASRSMLATVLSDPTPERWRDVPRQRVAEQLTRLAGEVANAVIQEIAAPTAAAAACNLAEFKVFWPVLREQVLELGADTPRRPWRRALTQTLLSLLRSVNDCMARFEMSLPPGGKHASPSSALPKWTASLHGVWAVLAELDAWPDLRQAMRTTLAAHATAVTALVLSAGRELCWDIRWITRHRDLLESEARRHLAMATLPDPELVAGIDAPPHEMLIDRARLLSDSFAYIALATPGALISAALVVAFKHEQATGPGVLREWFCLVCQGLFNPRLVLFSPCPRDRRRFFVNPTGRPITLDDIVDADPTLHASFKQILEMDPSLVDSDVLGLRFVREVDVFGSRSATELLPGGKDTPVTSENRHEFIDLLIRDTFVNSTRYQLGYFAEGFSSMLGETTVFQTAFFQSLDVEDFDEMLGGSKGSIDVKQWRAHTHYRGYGEDDLQITWFWKAVESMTVEQQRRLLFFWTSVKYLPSDGFVGLGFRMFLSRASSSCDHLPTSQTCFYHLNLPAYTSPSMMQNRLQMIVQEHVSSGFGTS
ncbi:hypothetical protein PAHAL_6G256800 [Panicum hallii]|uniref:HECT-type E3 ubiquitin transferase n=1 Tax=Panicum hallii TaxID=206008 RepID=A0A2T8IHI9_9POAL|nr:hypothetical protein PAHAL_6G256800 [Panicum hallii]